MLKLFKSKIEFSEEDKEPPQQRADKSQKFQFPAMKKMKSASTEPQFVSLQRTPSMTAPLAATKVKLEPIKVEKVQLCSMILPEDAGLSQLVTKKFNELQKSLDGYYEGCMKVKGIATNKEEPEPSVHQ